MGTRTTPSRDSRLMMVMETKPHIQIHTAKTYTALTKHKDFNLKYLRDSQLSEQTIDRIIKDT